MMFSFRTVLATTMALSLAASAHNAFAGQIVKNGGAIVSGSCYRDETGNPASATEVLDFYEAKVLRSWTIALGDANDSVDNKIQLMLGRLETLDPERVARLRQWLSNFEQERGWLNNGARLPTVDDIGEIRSVLPDNCYISQAAGQRIPDNPPFDPYYIFDTQLWNRLNNDSRAGLIVHELIYRDGVRLGHTESVGTRFLTSLAATDLIDRGVITPEGYARILFRNAFDAFTFGPFRLYAHNLTSSPEEAAAFCASLTPLSYSPNATREYISIRGGGTNYSTSGFITSAPGRYLLTLPASQRLVRTSFPVFRMVSDGFDDSDAVDQDQPAPTLCAVVF